MSNETKKQIAKAAPTRWLVFCILTVSGGIAFKLSSMKDMFYVPMQEFMGLAMVDCTVCAILITTAIPNTPAQRKKLKTVNFSHRIACASLSWIVSR